ncbi:hypothetical protein GOODEAATRI_018539 [Goodea atripinnis]|uniref:Uncharacterized protein n=1 Tax=Goodea atripinnis TaxID=208336 RepID=A0ABV0NBN3_9TELE
MRDAGSESATQMLFLRRWILSGLATVRRSFGVLIQDCVRSVGGGVELRCGGTCGEACWRVDRVRLWLEPDGQRARKLPARTLSGGGNWRLESYPEARVYSLRRVWKHT